MQEYPTPPTANRGHVHPHLIAQTNAPTAPTATASAAASSPSPIRRIPNLVARDAPASPADRRGRARAKPRDRAGPAAIPRPRRADLGVRPGAAWIRRPAVGAIGGFSSAVRGAGAVHPPRATSLDGGLAANLLANYRAFLRRAQRSPGAKLLVFRFADWAASMKRHGHLRTTYSSAAPP